MILTILAGDNIELLKKYPDNYFDSVVTDCPYGLGTEPNALKLLQDWIDHGYHEIKGNGFMGKTWDAFVPQPIFWKEVFRVLKPGGYLLPFFGTRTYDWGVMAIRLTGFEVRDMICWHYGSGFPKSLDISKQIDKMAGAERKVIGKMKQPAANKSGGNSLNMSVIGMPKEAFITKPATEQAEQYDGFGTALKPATEPIAVCRKPIEKGLTVAQNVLKWGTGGINIGDCLIEFESEDDFKSATFGTGTNILGGNYVGSKLTDGRKNIEANEKGRWPANVMFDPFMANVLDRQTGILISGKPSGKPSGKRSAQNNIYGKYHTGQDVTGFGDSGGASRFFYCAKSSQFERSAGCDHLEQKIGGMISNTSGQHLARREDDYEPNKVGNNHPTVKPIAVMRWLQRLVTPKGGKTLDPFAGSGTSGCAAYFENIGEIVLMEMEESYLPIMEARTKYWSVEQNRINYLDEIKREKVAIIENQFKLF